MKYKYTPKVQYADFSCLEELKVDMLETWLELLDGNIGYIEVLMDSTSAIKLYEKLLNSEINEKRLMLSPDEFPEEVADYFAKNKTISLTINDDKEIMVESTKYFDTSEAEFIYISKDIDNEYVEKLNNGKREILVFDIT